MAGRKDERLPRREPADRLKSPWRQRHLGLEGGEPVLAVEAVDEEEGDELEKLGRQDLGALGGNCDAQALVPHQAHRIHDTPAEAIRVCAGDVAVSLVEHQEFAAFRAPAHLVGSELVQQLS
ncbi:MAG: hypothetical protein ACK56F_09760, partial [bacterium]